MRKASFAVGEWVRVIDGEFDGRIIPVRNISSIEFVMPGIENPEYIYGCWIADGKSLELFREHSLCISMFLGI